MGTAYDAPILSWDDARLNYDHAAMLDGDISGAVEIRRDAIRFSAPPGREYAPEKHRRLIDSAKDIQAATGDSDQSFSAFLAMQDARLFPSVEYLGQATDAKCIQISYCRTVDPLWRRGNDVVLWPLTNDFKWWRLPTYSPAPWTARTPTLYWRGQPTGMSYRLAHDAWPFLPGIRRVRRWLHGWLKDEAAGNESCFRTWAGTYQRLVAADLCRKLPDTDVKLVPLYSGDRKSFDVIQAFLGSETVAERLEQNAFLPEQQRHKFILAVPGNDVPSSLRHDLLSGGLVLMPRPFWESVWFFGLKPDIHYIPLRADLADLEERLEWCRDNDSACREIAEAGRRFALEFFEPGLELEVQRRLVKRLAANTIPPGSRQSTS